MRLWGGPLGVVAAAAAADAPTPRGVVAALDALGFAGGGRHGAARTRLGLFALVVGAGVGDAAGVGVSGTDTGASGTGAGASDSRAGASDTGAGASDTVTSASDTVTGASDTGTGASDTGTGASDTGTGASGAGTSTSGTAAGAADSGTAAGAAGTGTAAGATGTGASPTDTGASVTTDTGARRRVPDRPLGGGPAGAASTAGTPTRATRRDAVGAAGTPVHAAPRGAVGAAGTPAPPGARRGPPCRIWHRGPGPGRPRGRRRHLPLVGRDDDDGAARHGL